MTSEEKDELDGSDVSRALDEEALDEVSGGSGLDAQKLKDMGEMDTEDLLRALQGSLTMY